MTKALAQEIAERTAGGLSPVYISPISLEDTQTLAQSYLALREAAEKAVELLDIPAYEDCWKPEVNQASEALREALK